MAKPEQILASLEKLYEKRSALDKKILETEKKLLSEAKPVAVAPKGAKKAASQEKPTRKPRTSKK
jgi:hypothetical protein